MCKVLILCPQRSYSIYIKHNYCYKRLGIKCFRNLQQRDYFPVCTLVRLWRGEHQSWALWGRKVTLCQGLAEEARPICFYQFQRKTILKTLFLLVSRCVSLVLSFLVWKSKSEKTFLRFFCESISQDGHSHMGNKCPGRGPHRKLYTETRLREGCS